LVGTASKQSMRMLIGIAVRLTTSSFIQYRHQRSHQGKRYRAELGSFVWQSNMESRGQCVLSFAARLSAHALLCLRSSWLHCRGTHSAFGLQSATLCHRALTPSSLSIVADV
jgi:hypothetical protein